MSTKIELTVEKSQEQADLLELAKIYLLQINADYVRELVTGMYNEATHYDTLAALNANYNPAKSKLIRCQAQALSDMVKFIKSLQECDIASLEVSEREDMKIHLQQLLGQ